MNQLRNLYKIRQDHASYGLHKFCLSNRVRTPRNSVWDIAVKAESVNSFKGRLDRFWNDKEVKFNWKADIKGTRSRRNLAWIIFYDTKFLCMQFFIIPITGHRGNLTLTCYCYKCLHSSAEQANCGQCCRKCNNFTWMHWACVTFSMSWYSTIEHTSLSNKSNIVKTSFTA